MRLAFLEGGADRVQLSVVLGFKAEFLTAAAQSWMAIVGKRLNPEQSTRCLHHPSTPHSDVSSDLGSARDVVSLIAATNWPL